MGFFWEKVMDQKLIKALTLHEIGQNLIIGDINVDLIELLSEKEFEQITQLRRQIGQHFIEQSGLPLTTEWQVLLKEIRKKESE